MKKQGNIHLPKKYLTSKYHICRCQTLECIFLNDSVQKQQLFITNLNELSVTGINIMFGIKDFFSPSVAEITS